MKRQIKVGRRSFLKGMAGTAVPLSIPGLKAKAQSSPPPPQNLPTGHFGDINENIVFDVCIVGSGFAGSVLGDALVKRRIKTVILESGADPRAKSFDERIQQLEIYRSSGPIEYPVISSRFRGLGGTSWYWGGVCPRLHPVDFEKNSYTPAGAAWPVSYKDLEPYYEKAEEALRVRGGKRSQYHPPSRRDYPIPPDRDISPLESLLKQVGIVISHVPFSTGKDHHLSFLHDHYGPFLLMTDSHLPAFRSSPFGTLISEVTVTRLVIDEAGCVTGAEIKDLDRNTKVVRARVYIVACGGLESPRLLLLSRSSGFPHGIGNNHDLVGRFFMEHRVQSILAKVGIGWRSFSFYALRRHSHQF